MGKTSPIGLGGGGGAGAWEYKGLAATEGGRCSGEDVGCIGGHSFGGREQGSLPLAIVLPGRVWAAGVEVAEVGAVVVVDAVVDAVAVVVAVPTVVPVATHRRRDPCRGPGSEARPPAAMFAGAQPGFAFASPSPWSSTPAASSSEARPPTAMFAGAQPGYSLTACRFSSRPGALPGSGGVAYGGVASPRSPVSNRSRAERGWWDCTAYGDVGTNPFGSLRAAGAGLPALTTAAGVRPSTAAVVATATDSVEAVAALLLFSSKTTTDGDTSPARLPRQSALLQHGLHSVRRRFSSTVLVLDAWRPGLLVLVTAILSFAAASASAGVTILFERDVHFCRMYPQLSCGRYALSVVLAFITWSFIATSAVSMFWLLPSL
ncbi:hypothetical protein ZEAMMB73_Zm00001d019915 [Zea mays]|uniref:CASP-like protein n=1 Tax=Zea mays TaxID=4577 RepID=A0A1D6I0Z4_MAIZE|nr:hypothetical protein ZEAMMB73_Zm00001d019915 [Zea mays]